MRGESAPLTAAAEQQAGSDGAVERAPGACVRSIVADVTLTPKLSVGAANPESIYEARFEGRIQASSPPDHTGACELELPMPPQIISLADLSIVADGAPSEHATLRDGKLVWRGELGPEPVTLDVEYAAVGKGLYELAAASGGLLDHYDVSLTAEGSDVRLLELSLQPTGLARSGGSSTYDWDYRRLLVGRPVRIDILGIAPIDRLGELTWLGPVSVVVFGLVVGLVAQSAPAPGFDRWMLLLTVGAFAGAYPLMYFAQEYVSLLPAVLISGGVALAVIAARSFVLLGLVRALLGVLVPAAAIMAVTLSAVVWPHLQGVLLTSLAFAVFVAAMMLMPRVAAQGAGVWGFAAGPVTE